MIYTNYQCEVNNMQWNKKFKLIEKALGFELKQWQRDYISMKTDFILETRRQTGKTTAFILRHLLNYENQLYMHIVYCRGYQDIPECLCFPCDNDKPERMNEYYTNFYVYEVMSLYNKLHTVGIKTSLDRWNDIKKMCKKNIS